MIVVLHSMHVAFDSSAKTSGLVRLIVSILSRFGAGVPMFFVISGYCIAATSDSIRRKPNAPVRYFYRRFRRIFPPYWAVVFISLVLCVILNAIGRSDLVSSEYGLIPHPSTLSWSQWLGNLTLTETWRYHLFGDPEHKILGVSWTLCYEEQFYAVCGLLLVFASRHFFSGVALISVLTIVSATFGGDAVQGFFFDGRWLMFSEGVLVYYLLNYSMSRMRGIGTCFSLFAIAFGLRYGLPGVSEDEMLRNRLFELVVSGMFATLLVILHPWDRRIANSKMFRPLSICGQMCYSLYLIHWPIIVVITTLFERAGVRSPVATLGLTGPIAILASIMAGWLFYISVERRFLNTPTAAVERAALVTVSPVAAGAIVEISPV